MFWFCATIWLASGICAAGIGYAHLQEGGPWPEYAAETIISDGLISLLIMGFGPLGLFAVVVLGGFCYGWRMPFTGERSFEVRLEKQVAMRGSPGRLG